MTTNFESSFFMIEYLLPYISYGIQVRAELFLSINSNEFFLFNILKDNLIELKLAFPFVKIFSICQKSYLFKVKFSMTAVKVHFLFLPIIPELLFSL